MVTGGYGNDVDHGDLDHGEVDHTDIDHGVNLRNAYPKIAYW